MTVTIVLRHVEHLVLLLNRQSRSFRTIGLRGVDEVRDIAGQIALLYVTVEKLPDQAEDVAA